MKLSNDVKLARLARQVHQRRRVPTVMEISIGGAARDFWVISGSPGRLFLQTVPEAGEITGSLS